MFSNRSKSAIVSHVDLKPLLAVAAATILFRGVINPAIGRYRAWLKGPRVRVARRNLRGVYTEDLWIIRFHRTLALIAIAAFVFSAAVAYTIMVAPG